MVNLDQLNFYNNPFTVTFKNDVQTKLELNLYYTSPQICCRITLRNFSVQLFNIKPRLHQDTFSRIQVVSTCRRLHVSCIGDKIVAMSPVYCCMDTKGYFQSVESHATYMSPRYSRQVSRTSNLYPLTCIRGISCSSRYMYPGYMYPGVNAALQRSYLIQR